MDTIDPGRISEASHIHATAIVEPGAVIGEGARIGPYCLIGPQVELGPDVCLESHVVVAGRTRIGAGTRIFPFASIGHQPQDLKYKGEPSTLAIGQNCIIREGVTINPGTQGGGLVTVIGDRCTFLANSHVAHDCHIGNDVVLSNNVLIAGHVTIGDYVIFGGGAAVIQHSRVGPYAFVGGLSGLENDLIPFGMALGNRAHLAGLNLVGLKRRGFSREVIHDLRRAYRLLFAAEGTLKERVEDVAAEFASHPGVNEIIAFIRSGGDRPICAPRDLADSAA